jgi:cytochrome c-type biogenesis protein CcmH
MSHRTLAAWLLAFALAPAAWGREAAPQAEDPLIERRLAALAHDLRCVVCQNESLAESQAPLAADLRREVRDLMGQGLDDAAVVQFLTSRYGDYVLYRPPLKPATYLLWLGPALFLGGAVTAWVLVVRRRQPPTRNAEPD